MSLYQRLLGHPFVYDQVRPFIVGGIDWSPLYSNLEAGPDDVVLDVGCGTGIAHQYLGKFAAYYGYDTDPVAIKFAREKTGAPNISYECRLITAADLERISPSRIILGGLLHHLNDDECVKLLRMCARVPTVKRIATSDVVYLPRQMVSNVLAYFDRGKFVRSEEGYLALIRKAGLKILRADIVRSHPENGRALYLMTALEPDHQLEPTETSTATFEASPFTEAAERPAEVSRKKFLAPNRRLGRLAVGIALATKLALFAWGVHVFPFKKKPAETVITIWNQWDSLTYLRIAEKHYSSKGVPKDQHEFDSHFPPLHPLLIRCVNRGLHVSPELAALLVSWSAGLAAAYLLAQLAWHEFRDSWSVIMSGILFHVYPVAYFLITPYSESLYFLLILSAFYFMRVKPRPFACAASLGLAILTRLMAINLAPVLGIKLLADVYARKRSGWQLLILGIPVLAIGVYLAINYFVYGSPLFFLHHVYVDPMVPRKPAIPLRETVSALFHFGELFGKPQRARFFMETMGWNSLFTIFVLALTLWGIVRRAIPWEYSLYSLCYILFFSSFEWGIGNVRYSYGAFPVFFILARSVSRTLLWEWLAVSVCLLLYFCQRYTNGLWAF